MTRSTVTSGRGPVLAAVLIGSSEQIGASLSPAVRRVAGRKSAVRAGQLAHPRQQHVDRRAVETSVGDDHVGVALGGLDEALVGGAHRAEVLVDHALGGAPALADVTLQAAD